MAYCHKVKTYKMGSAALLFELQVSWNRIWYINLVSFHSVMSTHFFECVQPVHCLPDDTFSQMINQDCPTVPHRRDNQFIPYHFHPCTRTATVIHLYPLTMCHSQSLHWTALLWQRQVQASLTLPFTSGIILTPNCRRKDSSENWQCFSQFLSSSAMHLSNWQFTDITYKEFDVFSTVHHSIELFH